MRAWTPLWKLAWPLLLAGLAACAAPEGDADAGTAADESQESSQEESLDGASHNGVADASTARDAERDAAGPSDGGARDASPPDGSLGALPACPGHQHPPPNLACRTLADCRPQSGAFACSATPSSGCGACSAPVTQCTSDAQCGTGRICVVAPPMGCACNSGAPNTSCASACTASSCGPGMRCGANGRCEVAPCSESGGCAPDRVCDKTRAGADVRGCAPANCETDGYECPAGYRCGGSSKNANGCSEVPCSEGYSCPVNTDCSAMVTRDHGCVRRTCSEDRDCDCGACIGRVCLDQLYFCSYPVP